MDILTRQGGRRKWPNPLSVLICDPILDDSRTALKLTIHYDHSRIHDQHQLGTGFVDEFLKVSSQVVNTDEDKNNEEFNKKCVLTQKICIEPGQALVCYKEIQKYCFKLDRVKYSKIIDKEIWSHWLIVDSYWIEAKYQHGYHFDSSWENVFNAVGAEIPCQSADGLDAKEVDVSEIPQTWIIKLASTGQYLQTVSVSNSATQDLKIRLVDSKRKATGFHMSLSGENVVSLTVAADPNLKLARGTEPWLSSARKILSKQESDWNGDLVASRKKKNPKLTIVGADSKSVQIFDEKRHHVLDCRKEDGMAKLVFVEHTSKVIPETQKFIFEIRVDTEVEKETSKALALRQLSSDRLA